jgi:cytochrome c556
MLAPDINAGERLMNVFGKTLAIGLLSVAGVAIAAEATDPTVKAWQTLMDGQGGNAKILGDMAGGKTAFDAAKAAEAAAGLAASSAMIADVFRTQASDPKSKASPSIWADYSGFEAKAADLMKAAQAMDTSTVEGVGAGMGAIGAACTACHKAYQS